MINAGGQYVLEENAKIRALLDKHRGHVRVVRRFGDVTPTPEYFNFGLLRFGLEVDMRDCQPIRYVMRDKQGGVYGSADYLACATKPLEWSASERNAYLDKKRRVNAVFDRLELVCPQVFQPRGLLSDGDGVHFWRNYVNTDTVVELNKEGTVTYRGVFKMEQDRVIGTFADLEKAMPRPGDICP
jgi:hypothetical protein